MPDNSIIQKSWSELTTDELYAFLRLRTNVFYVEQKVDEEELDDRDREPTTVHFFIADGNRTDGNRIVAYLRVIEDDEPEQLDARHLIGRVVVDAEYRGRGLAQKLIQSVIEQYGHLPMLLHAQSYIVPLYTGFGFETLGDEFVEAGIPHRSMYRSAVAFT
ncbi:GNAT family N-acetyltransferase [Subtercola endophyticus]|uniref:GNAT family N-acetyltransferase n=1 Tax=Subtercola endophyticus TaxID=2895559 RepID=UPI001E50961D|nr:GNAT family N-acetyltransferase [Subtercola endophyticus]UFS59598.1 GNAT family N-acetyltransferase [Subtercola endophyticus]